MFSNFRHRQKIAAASSQNDASAAAPSENCDIALELLVECGLPQSPSVPKLKSPARTPRESCIALSEGTPQTPSG